jgi:hypothetical protein
LTGIQSLVRILIVSALQTVAEWNEFLKTFAAAIGSERPGSPASSEERLSAVEEKLKIKLPPSYRTFLLATNGWSKASREVPVLRSVENIRWFKKEHRDWVQAYVDPMQGMGVLLPAEQDYFNYGSENSGDFDPKHLAQALCISEIGDDAVLLLNPMVIWPDGEWETWLFANWIPGAIRFRSFADWMRHELCQLLNETFQHSIVPDELPTVYLDGPAKPKRRIRPREEIVPLEVALKYLTSKTKARRMKAVRQLARLGGQEAVAALLTALKKDSDQYVRCEAAECLGKMRAVEAIDPLIEIGRSEKFETSNAIQALGFFGDERSAQCLLKLVEADGPSAGVAAHALAKRNDARGVPPLIEKLVSGRAADEHTGNIAGRLIAEFGEPGYLALEPLVTNEYLEIRRRAILGIFDLACLAKDKELKLRARDLLKRRLEAETNEGMREHLQTFLSVACNKNF